MVLDRVLTCGVAHFAKAFAEHRGKSGEGEVAADERDQRHRGLLCRAAAVFAVSTKPTSL
jgi:hypothetical protein